LEKFKALTFKFLHRTKSHFRLHTVVAC
jgi:hypothetical protein